MSTIISTIQGEIRDYTDGSGHEVAPGVLFQQYNTIQRIHRTLLSKFEDDSFFEGMPKIFFNKSKPAADAVARFLQVKVSQIRLKRVSNSSEFGLPFLDYEIKLRLQNPRKVGDETVSQKLKRMAEELCYYGTVVVEDKGADFEIVDLRNLYLDSGVTNIHQSRFVITRHQMDQQAMLEMVKHGWDEGAIKAIVEKKANQQGGGANSYVDSEYQDQQVSSQLIEVYRRFGYFRESDIVEKGDPKKMVYGVAIVAEPSMTSKDTEGKIHDEGLVLYKKKLKKTDLPFRDCHLQKIQGRYLGLGIIEQVFDPQERINELINQQRASMRVSMLNLMQTADPTIFQNAIEDLKFGDIVKTRVQGSLQPVVNENRNLSAFQIELNNYFNQIREITFANEVITGADIPASMAATTAVIQNNNSTRIQLFRRSAYTHFIRQVLTDFVLPKTIKELDEDHLLVYTGDQETLEKYDERVAAMVGRKKIFEALANRQPISSELFEEAKSETSLRLKKRGGERLVSVLKGYYGSTEFDLDFNIDNEQEDIATLANNTLSFAKTFTSEELDDPFIQELAIGYAGKLGLDTDRLQIALAKRVGRLTGNTARIGGANVQPKIPTPEDQLAERI